METLEHLDGYVERACQAWGVPGLAIAIVKDDKPVLVKGYGVRDIAQAAPVNAHTRFAIASATKTFTVTALGMLVDAGEMRWDDPVVMHLPGFQLSDPYVTGTITIRDLLAHRSGLLQGDLLWYGSGLDRAEILQRIRHLGFECGFRSRFGYHNVMYLVAGQVVEAVTSQSWDAFVQERIFAPLRMAASTTSMAALMGASNVALPHALIDGQVQVVPWLSTDNIAPAGGIGSSVADMVTWLRLHLSEGIVDDQRIVSATVIHEMQTPQTVICPDDPFLQMVQPLNHGTHFFAYGLGWFLQDYRGRKIVWHPGATDGMSAQVALVPEEHLGMVILTNMNMCLLPWALLMFRVVDAFLGGDTRDWSDKYLGIARRWAEQKVADQRRIAARRVEGTQPSLPLEQYAGRYEHPCYNAVIVAYEHGRLILRHGSGYVGHLEHWHYDTFLVRWCNRLYGTERITFTFDAHGQAAELRRLGVSFTRAA